MSVKNVCRKRRRAAGLCQDCGAVPEPPFITCESCRKHRKSLRYEAVGPDVSRAVDARLKASKRCPRCHLLMESGVEGHVCIGSAADYLRTPENPWEGA